MLELIFQGFMEWAYGLILECWQYFSSALLDIMSLDFAYLKAHVPVVNDIMQVLLAAGWALLIGNLVFQAIRSMVSGLGFEGEDPKLLFARTFVFAFLLLASPQICQIGLDITSNVISALEIPDAVNVTLVDESIFGALTASWLLVIICGIIIMFKVFRLILEIAERYVILAMLTITAPLAFAMGGSRNTSEIFTGWCRMFGSMCVLMATHVIFFKMLLSVLSTIPSGLDVLPWMILIVTIVKVAKKADAIVTRIGLNPAITGDNLGRGLPGALSYMVIRTAASKVTSTIGKSAGGSGRGTSPNTPPGGSGGGPRSGGPFGGRNRAGTGAGATGHTQQSSSQSTTQQSTSQQSTAAQQNATAQQSATQQGSTTQMGGQQTTVKEQSGGAAVSSSSQAGQGDSASRQSRQSAVPPGTRRSPSHVKSTTTPRPGGSMNGRPGAGVRQGPGAIQTDGVSQTTVRQESAFPSQGVPGAAAAVRPGTAGTAVHTDSSKRVGAPQPSTAGTGSGSTTRFTQQTAQKMQGGAAFSSMQAAEQNNISVDGRQGAAAADAPGQAPAVNGTTPRAPGASPVQHGQSGREVTRFTHRERTSEQSGRVNLGASSPPSAPGQPGTAGTGTSRSVERPAKEIRRGGDMPSVGAAPVSGQRHPDSPARQEARRTAEPSAPTVKGGTPQERPGTAGTASAGRRASQTRQTASAQTVRAKSTPTATDSLGGKRAASGAAAVRKDHLTPKGGPSAPKGSTRPPRQKRGSEHE